MAAAGKHADLRARLAGLESDLARTQRQFLADAPCEPLPGLYLLVDVASDTVLLPAIAVREIVRLVAVSHVAGSPPHVLGTFMHRGRPVLAVDVARCAGISREPAIDAHVVVLGTSVAMGLVVDRVRGLVQDPLSLAGAAAADLPPAWRASGLAAGLCRAEDAVRVLLSVEALGRAVGGAA